MIDYDDPVTLARIVAARPRPLLLGLDVDGVLAPIVEHADDAVLLTGMSAAISAVASIDGVRVAVVSGRSLAGLEQFGFDRGIAVIGSHGMERRDQAMAPLDDSERTRLARLDEAAAAIVLDTEGAWVERKPASVVVHVRAADPAAGGLALSRFADAIDHIAGATAKAGSGVLEAFARHADKGSAIVDLGARLGAATTAFVGDDLTDEEAFARLGPGDVTIKVGGGDTIARHRLRDPDAVRSFLRALRAMCA